MLRPNVSKAPHPQSHQCGCLKRGGQIRKDRRGLSDMTECSPSVTVLQYITVGVSHILQCFPRFLFTKDDSGLSLQGPIHTAAKGMQGLCSQQLAQTQWQLEILSLPFMVVFLSFHNSQDKTFPTPSLPFCIMSHIRVFNMVPVFQSLLLCSTGGYPSFQVKLKLYDPK